MTVGKYLKIEFRQTLTLQKARSSMPGAGRDDHLIMPCLVSLGAAAQSLSPVVSLGHVLVHGVGLLALPFYTP